MTNLDAIDFIRDILPDISKQALVYFDPPYYDKGRTSLAIESILVGFSFSIMFFLLSEGKSYEKTEAIIERGF